MRLFPEAPDEANSNLQWGVEELLRIVEEVVYESPAIQVMIPISMKSGTAYSERGRAETEHWKRRPPLTV